MLPALGTDVGAYNAASARTVILDQIRGCGPLKLKRSLERFASIYDSSP
jgi:hypothetical protein